jgi:hypothetical protein
VEEELGSTPETEDSEGSVGTGTLELSGVFGSWGDVAKGRWIRVGISRGRMRRRGDRRVQYAQRMGSRVNGFMACCLERYIGYPIRWQVEGVMVNDDGSSGKG